MIIRGFWLLCVALFFSSANAFAQSFALEGDCGEYSFWRLDTVARTLFVHGKGAMSLNDLLLPRGCHKAIDRICIGEGITVVDISGSLLHGTPDFNIPGSVVRVKNVPVRSSYYHDGWLLCVPEDTADFVVEDGTVGIADAVGYNLNNKYSKLRSVALPATLKYIGSGAFKNTPVEHVDIPCSVKTIGREAFGSCYRLKEVRFMADVPPEGLEKAFFVGKFVKRGTAYIPTGTMRAYEKAGIKRIFSEVKEVKYKNK